MTTCPRCAAEADYGLLCQPCESAVHAESFRPLADYTLARPCPDCEAPIGTECQHPRRAALAVSHMLRDGRDAPPPEEREPGRSYSSLPPVTEPVTEPVALRLARLIGTPPDPPEPESFWRALL